MPPALSHRKLCPAASGERADPTWVTLILVLSLENNPPIRQSCSNCSCYKSQVLSYEAEKPLWKLKGAEQHLHPHSFISGFFKMDSLVISYSLTVLRFQ